MTEQTPEPWDTTTTPADPAPAELDVPDEGTEDEDVTPVDPGPSPYADPDTDTTGPQDEVPQ